MSEEAGHQQRGGARARIRSYLEAHVGEVVTTHQIARVARIKDYPRRIRELRDEEGMQILSYRDREGLKPDEYLLESLDRRPSFARGVGTALRVEILDRNGYTCQLCGRGPGDPDPVRPDRKVCLVIDHVVPISQGGTDSTDNLRVLCSACNAGRSNIQPPSETARNILARVRKLSRTVQREVYDALRRTFETD